MGARARTVRCEGCFLGRDAADALAQAAALRQKCRDGEAGTLFVPGMEPMQALMKEIVLEASGEGRIIPYCIVFMEQDVTAGSAVL
jgi:hypothetical protein